MLKSKYLNYIELGDAVGGSKNSWVWQSIIKWKDLINVGLCYVVGNGRDILVWGDPWIPTILGFKPTPSNVDDFQLIFVVIDLIDSVSGQWDRSHVQRLFDQRKVEAIVQIHLWGTNRRDELLWIPNKSFCFSVKIMYWELIKIKNIPNSPVEAVWWKKLWRMKVHERFKVALGKLIWNAVPTRGNVRSRMESIVDEEVVSCVLCGGRGGDYKTFIDRLFC